MKVNRSQSLSALRNAMFTGTEDSFRRTSLSSCGGVSGFSSSASSLEVFEDIHLTVDEMRELRIENLELRAAHHRQKSEINYLKAQILILNGQLSKCRQLALMLKNHVHS